METDPLVQLESWGRQVERRVGRAHRLSRLGALVRWPLRLLRGRRLVVVVLVAAVGGGLWLSRESWVHWNPEAGRPYPKISHPVGVSATTSASAPPTDPFEQTPAATYAQGEAGIVMPPATTLSGWTEAQVAEALAQIRQALIARYLDRKVIVEHDPTVLLAQLAPSLRDEERRRFAEPAVTRSAVLISPGVRLAGEPPRVSGRSTVRTARHDNGLTALEVITNYVVVYAFDVPDRGVGSRLALIHQEITWAVYPPKKVAKPDRGLWIMSAPAYVFNIDCSEAERGLLAPSRPDRTATDQPSPEPDTDPEPGADPDYDPDQYYDPDRALDIGDTCN